MESKYKKYQAIIIVTILVLFHLSWTQISLSDGVLKNVFKVVFLNTENFLRPCSVNITPSATMSCGFTPPEIKESANTLNFLKSRDYQLQFFDYIESSDFKSLYKNSNLRFNDVIFEVYKNLVFKHTRNLEYSKNFANKVSHFWGKYFQDYPFNNSYMQQDFGSFLIFKKTEVKILFIDAFEFYNLNEIILKSLKCSPGFIPVTLIDYGGPQWVYKNQERLDSQQQFFLELTYQCNNSVGGKQIWTASVNVYLNYFNNIYRKLNFQAVGIKSFNLRNGTHL